MIVRCLIAALLCAAGAGGPLRAQVSPQLPGAGQARGADPLGGAASSAGSLLAQPALTPGAVFLMDLERQFAADVAKGGGKAFTAWFADDAVALSNGQPAKLGRGAIADGATWDAAAYQLTWTPTAA